MIIKEVYGEVEGFCNVCKNAEPYKNENKPVAMVSGDIDCDYCGNQIFLCKKHLKELKIQIKNITT